MERLIVAAEATEGARRVRGREGDHVPINTTISGRLTCAHEGGKTCDAFCRESFRAERQRVARRADDLSHRATESGESAFEEAARAARRALDAMVAWEARDDALERARRALADEEAAGTGTGAALRRAPDGGPGSGFPEADHYASLGIPADFTEAELKAGYRRASLRAHPDKVGGSSDAFARVAASYETLADDSVSYGPAHQMPTRAFHYHRKGSLLEMKQERRVKKDTRSWGTSEISTAVKTGDTCAWDAEATHDADKKKQTKQKQSGNPQPHTPATPHSQSVDSQSRLPE